MKLLLISDFFPDPDIPGGASTRVYHLMRELSRDHKITLLTTRWPGVPVHTEKIRDICEKVVFYDFIEKAGGRISDNPIFKRFKELRHILVEEPQMVQSAKRHDSSFKKSLGTLDLKEFDLIQVEDSYLAYRLFDVKKTHPDIPIVIDMHNVNTLMEKRNFELAKGWRWRTYRYFEWQKMSRYEKKVFNTFDLVLTCSGEDKKICLSMAPGINASVVPNGVDTGFFDGVKGNPEPNNMFFLGSDWPPNVDALLYFNKYIYPNITKYIPEVKFYIIGNFSKNEKVKALASKNIILTGYVKDVREWMGRASLSVVPLRMGGGTRLKILEALSMGKAVVSTSMGAEGIEVTSGENIILADDPESFAYAVVSLMKDREAAAQLGRNGRKLVEEKYDWKAVGGKLAAYYKSLRTSKQRSILYFLDIFPAVSETFIMNEILELERRGLDIKIIARRKEDGVPHDLLKQLKSGASYLPDAHRLSARQILVSHAKFFISHPMSYARTLIYAFNRRKKGSLWFFKVACVYACIISKYKFSRIHSHFASMASSYAMFISKLLGKPFTFTIHGWYDLYEKPPADLADRIEASDKVITISEFNKRYLISKFKVLADKIEVIHCGIDLSYFDYNPMACGPGLKADRLILSVARLHPVKNLELLIRACGLLAKKGNGFRCAIVGEGDERRKLENLINNLGLSEKVFLLGKRKLEEVRELYRQASIFVLPSKHETMGVTTMEAMASGVPVVSSNIYGIPELVDDGVNGYLVSPVDDKGLADRMEALLEDEKKRTAFGKMGRKKIEKVFNLKDEVDKLEEVWCDGKN